MAKFWDWVNKQANKQPATGDELLANDVAANANKGTYTPNPSTAPKYQRPNLLYDQTGMQPTTPGDNTQQSGGDTVTYIDGDGNAQKGTTGGTTEEAATETPRTYLDEMKDQYQKMYEDAVKANNDAAKAAADRSNAQVEQGIGELGSQYGNINKQLYRDYMESLRVLPQEMAARGYSGGMSESARLGLDTAYGERLNENEAARIAAIADLRAQGADAEYQANAARDQANAQAQQNLYANMMNLLLQQQQDAAQKAQNMAQYGDFSGYLGLGYTQGEIDQMQKAWIAANPELARTLGYVTTPSYSGYYNNSTSSGSDLTQGDKTISADGQQFTVNDHGETRFNGNMTRGEIQREARRAYANKEISLTEYNEIIRNLH